MIALDEVEWARIEGTPVEVAVPWCDPRTGASVRLFKFPAGMVAPQSCIHGRLSWRQSDRNMETRLFQNR